MCSQLFERIIMKLECPNWWKRFVSSFKFQVFLLKLDIFSLKFNNFLLKIEIFRLQFSNFRLETYNSFIIWLHRMFPFFFRT